MGIVNGTTNYILDRMDTEGAELGGRARRRRSALGYAEADPTADIEGYDAAQKAAILASLAFHTTVPLEAVHREGITGDRHARRSTPRAHAGYVVKLLAVCERLTDPETGIEGDLGAGLPGADPARPPARRACTARTTPSSSRPRPPATSCSTARAPAACRPRPPCSATWSRPRAATSPAAPGVGESHAREPADRADRPRHDALPDHARGRRPARRARDDRRRCSASTASRSRPSSRPSARPLATGRRRRHRYPGDRHAQGTGAATSRDTVDALAASDVVERGRIGAASGRST